MRLWRKWDAAGETTTSPGSVQVLRRAGNTSGAARVYVNAATPAAAPDGRTWPTALATIQEGLDAAARLGGGEVWVACGKDGWPLSLAIPGPLKAVEVRRFHCRCPGTANAASSAMSKPYDTKLVYASWQVAPGRTASALQARLTE